MDMDTDLSTDTEVVICIHICGTRIHVSGGFFVLVLNTTYGKPRNERDVSLFLVA